MEKNPIRILVSGAGVAGLSVAYWLARYGFNVTVVERAPSLRPGGQALDVRGAAALGVAERMGILAAIHERSTRLKGMSLVDVTGREIFRSTERTLTGGRFDSPDVEILRDHLCEVLHEAAGDQVEYLFGDSISSMNQDENGVDVAFMKAASRRFNLVIGADGLRSGVRRMVFGPDSQFMRYLGSYIAVFSVPNFLGLERWQIFCGDGEIMGGVLALGKDAGMRAYLGFGSAEPLTYDYRDVLAQKRLVTGRAAGAGWEFPRLVEAMRDAPDFYFDSMNQIRMDHWSRGRVVLLGDAGYSVSPATGQGTSVAMIAAYVLAGELAVHRHEPLEGIRRYEEELRDYVDRSQEQAFQSSAQGWFNDPSDAGGVVDPGSVPDFGKMALPFDLKNYDELPL